MRFARAAQRWRQSARASGRARRCAPARRRSRFGASDSFFVGTQIKWGGEKIQKIHFNRQGRGLLARCGTRSWATRSRAAAPSVAQHSPSICFRILRDRKVSLESPKVSLQTDRVYVLERLTDFCFYFFWGIKQRAIRVCGRIYIAKTRQRPLSSFTRETPL